ncbi:MAG: aminopeptidase P family protein [Oscillospiraceae bacterium]|nr:aminopeptidase P family protein [Oscillospiraceae bacterium]
MKIEIERLILQMKERGIFACIVPTDDFHGSEYVSAHFKLREYLSGFTGSAGTLLVTLDGAFLWTDGRYFLQAERELFGSGIELMRMGEKGILPIEKFLLGNLPPKSRLGFDGRILSARFVKRLRETLCGLDVQFVPDFDAGDSVWENRPLLPENPVFELPESVCGKTRAEKIAEIRERMTAEKADYIAVSALDEIAWTLNLRGGDIDFCPLFLAFMIVSHSKVFLFANQGIFSRVIAQNLAKDGVEILPYDEVYNALKRLRGAVWVDLSAVNSAFFSALENAEIIEKSSPITLMKAVKNSAEIAAEKRAHLLDGAAVVRFRKWLCEAVLRGGVTEITAADKLDEFRRMGEGYLGQSFAPIMAYGEHGAVVHYSADESTNALLEPHGLLLSDTGGHYLDGTTDITRTFVLGELSDEEKRGFTLALAGHLNLLDAEFPEGVFGHTLDYTAREPLWKYGLDFNHGTGHGVGFLLNVHEGPQRISRRALDDAPLCEGMITSDEPGLYVDGKFGIRHESLLLCVKSQHEGFLRFEPLTFVPFDRDGIDAQYLTERHIWLFNKYQKAVFDKLSPLLSEDEKKWLGEATEPI